MLAHLGYVVRADGQFGGHTANVIRSFRVATARPRSARVTPKFVRMLKRAQYGGRGDRLARHPPSHRGRQGSRRQGAAEDLSKLGYVAATDGEFGPQTRISVRSFERSAGLQIDGVVSAKEARTLKKIARIGREAGAVSKTPTPTVTTTPTLTAAPAAPGGAPPARSQSGCPPRPRSAPTGSPSLRPAHLPPSSRSSRRQPDRAQAASPATAAATTAGRTRATTAPARLKLRAARRRAHRYADVVLRLPRLAARRAPVSGSTVYGMQIARVHGGSRVSRFDTSASKGGGSRWTTEQRSPAGYVAVHPPDSKSAPPERRAVAAARYDRSGGPSRR